MFVEPYSGVQFSPKTAPYCSIKAVWNSSNFWASLQSPQAEGSAGASLDFSDTNFWRQFQPEGLPVISFCCYGTRICYGILWLIQESHFLIAPTLRRHL